MEPSSESTTPCRKGGVLMPNMGIWDRIARLVLGLGLLYVVLFSRLLAGEWLLQLMAVGFAFLNLFAVSTQWCPMYCFTGTDTRGATARGGV
jgi:hypothetical protein